MSDAGIASGNVTLFVRHTSASLTIQENADPDGLTDLVTALQRLAARDGCWIHDAEGPDDIGEATPFFERPCRRTSAAC